MPRSSRERQAFFETNLQDKASQDQVFLSRSASSNETAVQFRFCHFSDWNYIVGGRIKRHTRSDLIQLDLEYLRILCVFIRSKEERGGTQSSTSPILYVRLSDLVRLADSSNRAKLLNSGQRRSILRPSAVLTVHMLHIANRASIDRCLSPGPVNSTILLAATVLRFSSLRMCRMTSLPPIPASSSPVKTILMHSGTLSHVSPVMRGMATSAMPSPIPRLPTAPDEQVSSSLVSLCKLKMN